MLPNDSVFERVSADMTASNAAWLSGSGPQSGPRLVPDPFGPLTAAEQRQERINTAAEPYETMEPPDAGDLGIKIDASIPPQRARLIRFHTWVVNLQKQLAELEQGREALFEKLNLPAATEKHLEELAAADRTGLVQWMRAGAKGVLAALAREHEHHQLTERLRAGSYEAEVAQAALVEIEQQIDVLAAQIKTLEFRRRRFVADALVERAGPDGAAYLLAIKNLSDRLAVLMGLGAVARCGAEYAALPVALPGFAPVTGRDDRPRVAVEEKQVEVAAGPWRDLAETLGDRSTRGTRKGGEVITARMLAETCRCAAPGQCSCETRRFGQTSMAALKEAKMSTQQVDPVLANAMLRAGISAAADGNRLSEAQLDALRAGCGDNINKRIQLVTLADRAGILPA